METIKKGVFACLYMSKVSKKDYDHTNKSHRSKALAGLYKKEQKALIDEELAREAMAELIEIQRKELEQYLVDSYTVLLC